MRDDMSWIRSPSEQEMLFNCLFTEGFGGSGRKYLAGHKTELSHV